ncbi:hypothetical protein PAMA_017809 [Pampus argenteus]
MSRKQSELEGRLDDMLSRIAMETQEIKELEQQLTNGQILANEALQRDLEGIISGLQEYMRLLREQARQAQQQVHSLQAENQRLQLQLEDTQRHCRQLQHTARTYMQNMSIQQEELSVLQMEAQTLRHRQVESSRQQVELEVELQQLREELTRQLTLGQDDKSSLQQMVHRLQVQLDQTRDQLHWTRAQQRSAASLGCQEESEKYRLASSVEQLYRSSQHTQTNGQQVQQVHNQNQRPIDRLQAQLAQDQDQDQVTRSLELDQDQVTRSQDQDQELDQELQKPQSTNRHNVEAQLQLQDVQQERDALLLQLHSQSDRHQRSLRRLNRKLQQLSKFMSDSDQLTSEQLRSTAEQLRALHHTVELLHTQKTEEEFNSSFHQNTHTLQDEHIHTVEDLRAELAEVQQHAHRLRQQLDRSWRRSRNGSRDDQWSFIPPGHSASSLGSQGTQDSGLGLQYLSSPEGGRQQHRPPTAGGYCVYIPLTHTDCDTEADPPSAPAMGASAGLFDGQLPLVGPAWLLCASPAAVVCSCPAGGAALHCDIHVHTHKGGVCECERLREAGRRLEEEQEKPELETKQQQHTLRRHRSVKLVCDEVKCLEKTLLKRRAELRQADRRLLEAQSCIHTTRDQVEQQEQRKEEHQTALNRLKEVRQEEQRLRSAVKELWEQQEALLSENKSAVSAVNKEEQKLLTLQSELNTHRAELKQVLHELLAEQQALEEVKHKRTQALQRLHRKQDELDRKQHKVDQKREELAVVQQELDSFRKESESCLQSSKQQRTELQEEG